MISASRHLLRAYVPVRVRQKLAYLSRTLRDSFSRSQKRIVRWGPDKQATALFKVQLSVVQAIRATPYSAGKIENIHLAAGRLSHVLIPPGSIFSFWALVGPPTAANGFKLGRSIIADRLSSDTGGGLCQLSGLVYELGLRGGLQLLERHAHTRDLYTEETRFTPLGLDATVVWGFKDLRLQNNLPVPVAFAFHVTADTIRGDLLTPLPIRLKNIRIDRRDSEAVKRLVEVYSSSQNSEEMLVSRDLYVIDPAPQP